MTYEELLIKAENNGIKVKEKKLKYGLKGLYRNNKIIIDNNLDTNIEKKCVLIEELGHHETSSGNIIDYTLIENKKQEIRARRWGYEKIVSIFKLIDAFERGATSLFEIAEIIEVPEYYLKECIDYYRKKYGLYFNLYNYVIYFEPYLNIIKKF